MHRFRLSRLLLAVALLAGAACSGDGKERERLAPTTTTTTAPTTTTRSADHDDRRADHHHGRAEHDHRGQGAGGHPAGHVTRRAGLEGLRGTAVRQPGRPPRLRRSRRARRSTWPWPARPARTPAARIGSLLFNPGGPGNSGVDALPGELRTLTAGIQNRFDIVSWDPRGIERSAPVRCSDPKARPAAAGAAAGRPSTPPR